MFYVKRSIGCGVAVNISVIFAIRVSPCYFLIISILSLKSYIEISKDID